MPIEMLLAIIWLHFVADFILQTDNMAKGKSKSNRWLAIHVGTYSLPLIILGPLYALVNGVAHFAIDYVTSRWSSKLLAKGEVHNFFVVIGFDQALHLTTLVLTYLWIGAPLWV